MCGKVGDFRKLATETENKVNFNRDFSRRGILDPEVYTLVRKCYNMRVKLYHILNTIHKVIISRIKWIRSNTTVQAKRRSLLIVLS